MALKVYDEHSKDYEVARHSLFFNDTGSRQLYKQYVRFILERRNSRNGRLYSEDPTIFAWDLINEPRCETWKVRSPASQLVLRRRRRLVQGTSSTRCQARARECECCQTCCITEMRILLLAIR
jgi:hypothetical protein